MSTTQTPSVPTPADGGRDTRASLDAAGIAYEVVGDLCDWCGVHPADTDPEMDGCCSEDCRYLLARAEGFVTDAEHEEYVAEGWVPSDAA